MCGIAGYATLGAQNPDSVRRMVAALERRGPDAEGVHCWPQTVLGHRRLAILDLSPAGNQPMLSEDGRVGVVFNGCIYNFRDLRRELEAAGHAFRSECDTEVLLRGYLEWGVDAMVSRLRGMFAFGIWDEREGKLMLVRDRLGVKPLVYALRPDGIAFASTLAALRAAGVTGPVDPMAVLEFLEFGYVTDARAIYQGAAKVPAGTIVEWQDGRFEQRRYWQLPEAGGEAGVTFEEAVEETERLLVESVRLRLQSDVPIGALLSGGIDSTLVCWAMGQSNAQVKAFTVSTPGDQADETADARETAQILGIPQETVTLAREAADPLAELNEAYSEPFACPSAMAMIRVSRAVKPMATVLLTGDGGDDVFLGYRHQRTMWQAQRAAEFLPGGAASLWPHLRGIGTSGALKRGVHFLDYATGGLGAVARVHDGLPFYQRHGLLGEKLDGLQLAQRQIPLSLKSGRRVLYDVLQYDYRTQFVGEFMTKVDGGTMHQALEARSPFLDQKMWEFAARLSPAVRLRSGVLKAVLREIVRKRVGPRVAARKKRGFSIPVERWLAKEWKPSLERLLEDRSLERQGWIREGSLAPVIRRSIAESYVPLQLWYLVVLQSWLEKNA